MGVKEARGQMASRDQGSREWGASCVPARSRAQDRIRRRSTTCARIFTTRSGSLLENARRLDILRAATLASLLLATAASADWPANGKRVGSPDDSFNGTYGVRFVEMPSGDLGLVMFGVGVNSFGYSMQRIGRGGDLAPGWPADGIVLGECSGSILPIQHGFVGDDSGCVWHGGFTNGPSGMCSQLIRPDGVLLPGTFASWQTFTSAPTAPADAAPAPGGAYILVVGQLQRMTRAGTPAPGWPANGVGAVSDNYDGAAIGDGAGGVVVFAAGFQIPVVQRLDANAARHPGWPASGVLLSNDVEDVHSAFTLPMDPLIASGPDGFIAGWATPHYSAFRKVKLQRFLLDGTLDPAWPPGGLVAVATDSIAGVTLIPDGFGGGHVLWYSLGSHSIRGTHVLADGQFAAGLGPQGIALPAPGSQPHITTRGSNGLFLDFVPADAAPNGGLVFAWNDDALTPAKSIRVRWLRSDYTADPSEPAAGRAIPVSAELRGVHADGVGGAFVAWEQSSGDPPPANREIWMTRLLPSSLVGVPRARHAGLLALSAPRPNPACASLTFDVALPGGSVARVELLDVAGRVVRVRSVQGAGAHAVSFDELRALAPGLYFARLVQSGDERTVRVVIAR